MKSECKIVLSVRSYNLRAVAFFFCRTLRSARNNASTVSGILALLDGPKLGASTAESVRLNISTHFRVERQTVMASCRLRLTIGHNFTGCRQVIHTPQKTFSQQAHVLLWTKKSWVFKNYMFTAKQRDQVRSSTFTSARAMCL